MRAAPWAILGRQIFLAPLAKVVSLFMSRVLFIVLFFFSLFSSCRTFVQPLESSITGLGEGVVAIRILGKCD
jgi:hypothetical protein